MAYLETDTQANINIASATNIAAYTATYNGQELAFNIYAIQLAGNGDYVVYVSRTPSGGSEATIGPKTTIALASGETTLSAESMPIRCQNGTQLKVYIDGLAGDTTTPDTTVNWYDATPVQPTTAGRTLDVSAGGEAGVDWANVGTPGSTVDLAATTVKTATDIATILTGITSLANWLRGLFRKDAMNATAKTEVNTGGGTYNEATDSNEALRADIAAIQTDVDDLQSRTPAALVSGRMDSSVGAMAAGVVTAAAVATDAIDADALAADAVAEIQSGLATSANQTTILARLGAFTGTGVNTVLGFLKALASKVASTPSDIGGTFSPANDSLEAISDTLTTASYVVDSVVNGEVHTWYRGSAESATFTVGDITGYAKVYYCIKSSYEDDDSASVLLVDEDDGLTVLNGAAPVSPVVAGDATLTVNDASTGSITVAINSRAAAQLNAHSGLVWGVKAIIAATTDAQQMARGVAVVSADIPKAIT